MKKSMDRNHQTLRIFTWHIHGSYLYYLTQTPCIFYLPFKESREEGYGGRTPNFPWGDNVINVPADKVKEIEFDVILFQSKKNYLEDQFMILSGRQRDLPKIYLEHDPPRETPTDTHHVVDDPNVLLVHVTHFNDLMWNSNRTPTTVIPHGVNVIEQNHYTGELEKGIVVINGIVSRGRRLGLDVFLRMRESIPLDIVGMGSEEVGGFGEIPNRELPEFISRYRFFFNPIRYTSLGLSVCEAMMTGLPIIGLATTEMPSVIRNDYSGYVDTNVEVLAEKMKRLLQNSAKARQLSEGAHETAMRCFHIERFKRDWLQVFHRVTETPQPETIGIEKN